MIKIKQLFPSGALEVSAMVRSLVDWSVYLERQTYYGYTKSEARKAFVIHMTKSSLILVND